MNTFGSVKPAICKKKRVRRRQSELERPFVCRAARCTRSYGTKAALSLHQKLKHGGEQELTSWNELQHKTPSHTNKTVNEPAMISATSTCSSENDSQIENTQPAPRCKSTKKSPTKRRQSSKKRVIRREATASSDEQDQLNNKHCLPRLFSPCGTPLTPPSFYSKNKPQFFLNGHQCLRDEDVAATLLFELAKNSPDALTPFDRDSFVLVL